MRQADSATVLAKLRRLTAYSSSSCRKGHCPVCIGCQI